MKILVYGAGVLGSYLAHVLISAGNEVALLARGQRKEELEQNGLSLRHYVQNKATIDHPHIVVDIGQERYDIVFAVMQYQQMKHILDDLATVQTSLVMIVGNNLSAPEMEAYIQANAVTPRTVLFGFQTTGGRRENGQVVCVRKGASGMHCGLVHALPSQDDRDTLERAFKGTKYRLSFQPGMYGWYLSHLAFILPVAYLCYALDCDLTRANRSDLLLCVEAAREGFHFLRALDIPILPVGEDSYFEHGPKRIYLSSLLWVAAKTPMGRLVASEHCSSAVAEMQVLDEEFQAQRNRLSTFAMPHWDALRAKMPSWQQLSLRWNSGAKNQTEGTGAQA